MARRLRWLHLLAFTAPAALACIPQPPPDLVSLPPTRPTIVRSTIVPPTNGVIGNFPGRFIIDVELADPTQSFVYVGYVDYNPFTSAGVAVRPLVSRFEPSNTVDRIRTVNVDFPTPSSDRCHVIEILVASALVDDGTERQPVEPPGGDLVTWFYNPGGALEGCPSLDAGSINSPDAGDGGDADAKGSL